MSGNRRNQTFFSRCAASAARRWRHAQWRWRAANKARWFVAGSAGIVITLFAFVLNSVHAAKVEQQSLTCLALNVYFEARGEPKAGRYAVAEVTMNRVASPRYPASVCGVVYQQNWDTLRKRYVGAFSWTEFETLPEPKGKDWLEARQVAEEVYYRRNEPKLADALHYHADHIRPSWSRHRARVAQIGNHVFYR